MSCGDGVTRGAAKCICKGQVVFEGAVIGQVFTGDVQMVCPHTQRHDTAAAERARVPAETGHSLSSALMAIGIWQAIYAAPATDAVSDISLSHAAMFLVASCLARNFKPKLLRWICRRASTGADVAEMQEVLRK